MRLFPFSVLTPVRTAGLVCGVLTVSTVILTGLLAGCGGGTSTFVETGATPTPTPSAGTSPTPSPTPTPTPSPSPSPSPAPSSALAGVWSGTYAATPGGTGNVEITIDNNGVITGRAFSNSGATNGQQGTVSGALQVAGIAEIIFTFGGSVFGGIGVFNLNTATDTLSGNFVPGGESSNNISVTLTRGPLEVE